MSKNILHLMGMDSTKYGGIERYNVELSKQLYAKGYHSVFVFEEYPSVQQFVDDLLSTDAEFVVINSRTNVINFCKDIWRLYSKYDFCTVHAHFTKARFYALPLAALYGIRNRIYTIHSTIEPLSQIKLHTRLWYHLMNKMCRVVTVSKQIESVSKSNWPKSTIKTIYLGIEHKEIEREVARNEMSISNNTMIITTISNFNKIKGLDILCHAVKYLVDNHKMNNVMVYIIGQPKSEMQELKMLIEQMSIDQYVKMEGIKNNVPTYLNATDIYVQSSRHEGLPLALMEATSVGLPIVASDVGGIPEVAQENRNAILVPAEDSKELAKALDKLISDSKLRIELGRQSLNVYQESFCLKQNVANLIKYYSL